MRFRLLVSVCAFAAQMAFAADYYVDTDNGSNSNSGIAGAGCVITGGNSNAACWTNAKANLDNAEVAVPNPLTSPTTIHVRGTTADTTVFQRPHGTTSTNTLTIQTDPQDRNMSGVWDNSKYHLVVANATGLSVFDVYENVYGLQIKTSSTGGFQGAHAIGIGVALTAPGRVNLAYNILVGDHANNTTSPFADAAAIHTGTTNLPVYIYNNTMYNWVGNAPSTTTVLCVSAYGTTTLFNNTCQNSRQGFYLGTTTSSCAGAALAKNNLFISVLQPMTAGVSGCSFASGTDYNATDGSALLISPATVFGGDGTHEQLNVSTSNLFNNSAGGDFSLTQLSSTQVRGAGATDPGSGLFGDDTRGRTRAVPWDIGAFMGPLTYWVSPTGTATWTNCAAAAAPTSSNNAAHCPLATANANANAGDVIYLRGGAYSLNVASLAGAIQPANQGSSIANRIIYSAAAGETPVLTNANPQANRYGVLLTTKAYVKVAGITFVDWDRWALIKNLSHHNELVDCEFYWTAGYINSQTTFAGKGIFIQSEENPIPSAGSTHNWIHRNKLHDMYAQVTVQQAGNDPCECGDIIRVGSANVNDADSDNNTIEDNLIYHAGHTLTDNFGHKTVWRNNVGHQEGFKTAQTPITGTATGGSSTSLIDTGKNFATAGDLGTGVTAGTYWWIHDLDAANAFGQLEAKITSVSTTTNPNDTLNYTSSSTTPTFTGGGPRYSITSAYTPYPAAPSNGLYAHRNFELDSVARDGAIDNQLFEGNRGGHSSPNPNNDGHEGLSLTSQGIIRYNFFFNNSASGLYFKNGPASSNNVAYNNTMFHNGRYAGIQHPIAPVVLAGLRIPLSTTLNAKLKNNLMYDNPSDVVGSGGSGIEWAFNWCTGGSTNGCVGSADPLFTNPDISDPMSTALPDLTLQSGSPAIDAGGHLTTATGAGSGSTTLVVGWARYFQDGTWGSDLARPAAGLGGTFQADWIAIGTVGNTVQITAVDYSSNTITLASPTTWANGDKVWLYKRSNGAIVLRGAAPDIGAFESSGIIPTMTAGATVRGGAVRVF